MTLLYLCYNVPNFLEKLRLGVLNISLNLAHILSLFQWGSCLFRICSGPFRISLMAEKEAIIDTKTPGSWH